MTDLQWKLEPPQQPRNYSSSVCGDVRISIGDAHDDPRQWQYIQVCCGRHSTASHDECRQTWPREAIAMARAALDEFEAKLGE